MTEIVALSLLDHVLKRPSLYLGKRSLYGLRCFIVGLILRNYDFGIEFEDFEKYVICELLKKETKRSFRITTYDLAMETANQDDEKAFDIWTDWLKEYKKTITK